MSEDKDEILDFALQMGCMMLESGAETQRIQWTMEMILSNYCSAAQSYVIPTGVFAGIYNTNATASATRFRRITDRRVDLERIMMLNDIARKFKRHELNISQSMERLEKVKKMTEFNPWIRLLCYGLISLAFTILFGGAAYDGFASFIVGILLGIAMLFLGKFRISSLITNIIGGIVITFFALLLLHFGIGLSYIKIITGSLMPLVPGFAITSAARDMAFGDIVSGTAKAAEAVFISVGITFGVLIVLHLRSVIM